MRQELSHERRLDSLTLLYREVVRTGRPEYPASDEQKYRPRFQESAVITDIVRPPRIFLRGLKVVTHTADAFTVLFISGRHRSGPGRAPCQSCG